MTGTNVTPPLAGMEKEECFGDISVEAIAS
jgi:hypothetical protein